MFHLETVGQIRVSVCLCTLVHRRSGAYLARQPKRVTQVARNVPPQTCATGCQALEDVHGRIELHFCPLVARHQFVGRHLPGTINDVRLAVVMPPIEIDDTILRAQFRKRRRLSAPV